MKFVANPVEVQAFKIEQVHKAADGESLILTLETHENVIASPGMTARICVGVRVKNGPAIRVDGKSHRHRHRQAGRAPRGPCQVFRSYR